MPHRADMLRLPYHKYKIELYTYLIKISLGDFVFNFEIKYVNYDKLLLVCFSLKLVINFNMYTIMWEKLS